VWPSPLILLHTVSDGLIALAYTWIPAVLVVILAKRKDIPVNYIVVCFALFIVLCGLTHVMGVVTVWWPTYWLAGYIKGTTAVISLATAWLLAFRVYPLLLSLPTADTVREARDAALASARALEQANAELRAQATRESATTQELRDKLLVIERQKEMIQSLSTPAIQIWDRVVMLPMIGIVDRARAAIAMESMLRAVSHSRARFAILDLTGTEGVDSAAADHLLQIIRAGQMLGAELVMTGIQPNVAQTMATIGVELRQLRMFGTVSDGLGYCLERLGQDRRR
jgi:anti-anti-sigma regulatory factor